jgi:(p)ppGpp synthase/HD superfamily hydrolase
MTYRTADMSNPRVNNARIFASAAHAAVRQTRKYAEPGEEPAPYIVHPIDVCAILQELPESSGVTVEMEMAALLHDTVEDTRVFENGVMLEGITLDLIEQEFGPEVRRLVSGLTDVSMPWEGNRKVRKAIDLAHTAEQTTDVHTIKLADLISNAPGIIENSGGFARKWMSEKGALLQILSDGDPILYEQAMMIYRNYQGRN